MSSSMKFVVNNTAKIYKKINTGLIFYCSVFLLESYSSNCEKITISSKNNKIVFLENIFFESRIIRNAYFYEVWVLTGTDNIVDSTWHQ